MRNHEVNVTSKYHIWGALDGIMINNKKLVMEGNNVFTDNEI